MFGNQESESDLYTNRISHCALSRVVAFYSWAKLNKKLLKMRDAYIMHYWINWGDMEMTKSVYIHAFCCCAPVQAEHSPRPQLSHCLSLQSNHWTLISPQPHWAKFELACHSCMYRTSKSSRGKVEKKLFSNWLMKIFSSNWTFCPCLCLMMPALHCF